MIFGSALISRLSFSKTKIVFSKEMWKKDDQNPPPFLSIREFQMLPEQPMRSQELATETWDEAMLLSLTSSSHGGPGFWEWLPDHAGLSFFFKMLIAGLYSDLIYDLLWSQIPAEIQNSLSCTSLSSNQSLFHSSLSGAMVLWERYINWLPLTCISTGAGDQACSWGMCPWPD